MRAHARTHARTHTHTHTHRATIKIMDFQVFYMKEIKYALCGDHMHASVHM